MSDLEAEMGETVWQEKGKKGNTHNRHNREWGMVKGYSQDSLNGLIEFSTRNVILLSEEICLTFLPLLVYFPRQFQGIQ